MSAVVTSANEKTALRAWRETYPKEDGMSFKDIARCSGLPSHLVRRTVRSLARKGLAKYYRTLWWDDGEKLGAGYGLTPLGREIMGLEEDRERARTPAEQSALNVGGEGK